MSKQRGLVYDAKGAFTVKSRITRIVYTQKKYLGHYESCEVSAEATVDQDDKPAAVMHRLKRWVGTQVDEGPYVDEETTDEPK